MLAKTRDINCTGKSPDFSGLFGLFNEAAQTVEAFDYLMELTQKPIKSDDEVIERAQQMDEMLDLATSEQDLYFIFGNLIADRIEEYEEKHLDVPKVEGRAMLALLMKSKKVKQSDLSHITAQSNISEILNGKRDINLDHAKGFSEFFDVPLTVFID